MAKITDKYRRFAVIGAARSGVAVAKLLVNSGYEVYLSDAGNPETFFLKQIEELKIGYEFGGHSDRIYNYDAMVVSPGISRNSEVIRNAFAKGIEVFSEIEIASWFSKGKIIAVTGTNGKTTTTTLIGKIFSDAQYHTLVCGNIGKPFSDVVTDTREDSVIVLEASSFQLENIKYFKPMIAIFLNLTPDHLDRHNTMEEYRDAKMMITRNQDINDHFIYNYDDGMIKNYVNQKVNARLSAFSKTSEVKKATTSGAYLNNYDLIYYYYKGEEKIVNTQNMILKGLHNHYNSMAGAIAARISGIDAKLIQKSLENFRGVEHRLEFVRDVNGIKFYNDSKATNVNSVWYALNSFDEKIILILGGVDKGNDYGEIAEVVREKVKHIVALGESKKSIIGYFKDIVKASSADDMEDAIYKAAGEARKGEIVLLSPACASFDMFKNYEERGNEFKRIVNSL